MTVQIIIQMPQVSGRHLTNAVSGKKDTDSPLGINYILGPFLEDNIFNCQVNRHRGHSNFL